MSSESRKEDLTSHPSLFILHTQDDYRFKRLNRRTAVIKAFYHIPFSLNIFFLTCVTWDRCPGLVASSFKLLDQPGLKTGTISGPGFESEYIRTLINNHRPRMEQGLERQLSGSCSYRRLGFWFSAPESCVI